MPYEDPANATHASKVVGIAGITIVFRDDKLLERVSAVYDAIHGYKSQLSGNDSHEWVFRAPVSSDGRGWTLRLRTATEADGDMGTLTDVFVQLNSSPTGRRERFQELSWMGWKSSLILLGNRIFNVVRANLYMSPCSHITSPRIRIYF